MIKERAQELSAMLRSGEYKQGKHLLHPTSDTFCCLGVACDMFKPTWVEDRWDGEGNNTTLPNRVVEYFGFHSTQGRFALYAGEYSNIQFHSLSALNDEGFTFNQIADIIDYFWEEL